MARRRKSNRRRRRGNFAFLYKLLSVLVICAAIVAALTLFFKVETIVVTGTARYTEAELLDVIPVKQGDNLFLLNKFSIAESIMESLPYVEEVRVNRKLPDTLLIEVAECQAAAVVMYNGAGWLISSTGKIVEEVPAADAKVYPAVQGCTAVEPVMGEQLKLERESDLTELLRLLSALEKAGTLDQLQSVQLGDMSTLSLTYGGRFTVELPRGGDYDRKMEKLPRYIERLESNETGTFDMTEDTRSFFIPYS